MRTAVEAVIIGIVVLLTGDLLLIASDQIRIAAARAQCQNNLKQIGISLHSYHGECSHFPAAAVQMPNLPRERSLSWLLALAPYHEATDRYVLMDQKQGWDSEENRYLALTRLSYLSCPAFPDRPPESTLIPVHYVGVAGLGEDAAALPLSDPRSGFFGYNRELRLADIADRTSTLIAAIETTRAFGAWTAGGSATVRGLVEGDPPYLGLDRQFGGLHPRGVNVLLADVSARLIRESIDPGVLEAMATIKGSKDAELPADR
jgi:hypothetical protein